MCRIFLSWYDGHEHPLAQELFELIGNNGFSHDHSPYSPHSGIQDPRWNGWYKTGLPTAIQNTDIFVAVITPSCDASTWMMVEYQTAFDQARLTGKPTLCYVRFDSIESPVRYPSYYLEASIQLASEPEQAFETLRVLCQPASNSPT